MDRFRRLPLWWLFILVGAMALAPQLVEIVVAQNVGQDGDFPLTISVPGRTLSRADLNNPASLSATTTGPLNDQLRNISAASENVFQGGYFLNPSEGALYTRVQILLTTDGTVPSNHSTTVKKIWIPASGNPAPQTDGTVARNYKGNLTLANLSGSSNVIRFLVQVYETAVGTGDNDRSRIFCDPMPPETTACPNSASEVTKWYHYYIDRSRPKVDGNQQLPALTPGSSFPFAVTADNRTQLKLRIEDDPDDTPADFSKLKVFVNNAEKTSRFTKVLDAPQRRATLNWTLSASDPAWPAGENTVKVQLEDFAGNTANTTTLSGGVLQDGFKFYVDKTQPTYRSIITNAFYTAQIGGASAVGFGNNITVKVKIADNVAINTNGDDVVSVRLFNDNRNPALTMTPVFLPYSADKQRFETEQLLVPTTWPREIYPIHLEIKAKDMGGNERSNITRNLFNTDPSQPTLEVTGPGAFRSQGPYEVRVRAVDAVDGIRADTVVITMQNQTGTFASTTGWTKTGNTTFTRVMDFLSAATGTFSASIPDASNGATILWNVTARDSAGNKAEQNTTSLRIDRVPPTITEFTPKAFRGVPSGEFSFAALDEPAGINAFSGNLSYRLKGQAAYSKVPLTFSGNILRGQITQAFDHGATVEYFVEARDRAGNLGTDGTAAVPKTYRLDRNPPTVGLAGPSTDATGAFTLTATASDDLSGVDTITYQARPAPGGGPETQWITFFKSEAQAATVCLPGGTTYEFRTFGTDQANNTGTPGAAQVTTSVTGAGCPQRLTADIAFPSGGTVLNAQLGTAKTKVQYSVRSTGTLTSPDLIKVTLEFSPDGGLFYAPLISKGSNTGELNWTLSVPSCSSCRMRLSAEAPGIEPVTTVSLAFVVTTGAPKADLDGNGLFDECELKLGNFAVQKLGAASAKGDEDEDGLSNAKECELGTVPLVPDTDQDGYSDGDEVRTGHSPLSATDFPSETELRFTQFDASAWIVVGLFLVATLLFVFGLTRRW